MYPTATDIVKEWAAELPERNEKFSPGKWWANGRNICSRNPENGIEDTIATVCMFSQDYKDEEAANVALMTASPEMYDVLEGCAAMLAEAEKQFRQHGDNGHANLCAAHAKAAAATLARARGEK